MPTPLYDALRAFAEERGWKIKELFSAVRTAVTGKVATPPLFSTMRVLGREMTRKRLRDAVAALKSLPAS